MKDCKASSYDNDIELLETLVSLVKIYRIKKEKQVYFRNALENLKKVLESGGS